MKAFLVFCSLALAAFLHAGVEVDLSLSSQHSDGQPIQMTVSVEISGRGDAEAPQVEDSDVWELLGPSTRQSSNFTLFNGQRKSSSTKVYVYQLVPLQTGTHQSPRVTIVVDGKEQVLKREAIKVSRVEDSTTNPSFPSGRNHSFGQNPGRRSFQWPSEDGFDKRKRSEVVVVAEPSKTEVYRGELIELPFYVYYRGANVSNFEFGKFPEFKGFLKEELNVPKHLRTENSRLNGQVMYRSEIIRYALFPIKSGDLLIDPLKMRVEVSVSPQNLFDDLFNNNGFPNIGFSRKRLEKSSGATPILVKELPPLLEGQSFSGGVGSFSLDWSGPKSSVQVGQPFNIQVTLTGKGNIKAIEEPVLDFKDDLESFKTTNRYEFKKDASGFKTFEYLFTPKRPGPIVLNGLKWTYFDPDLERYVELKTEDMLIQVEGAPQQRILGENASEEVSGRELFTAILPSQSDFKQWGGQSPWSFVSKPLWFVSGVFYLAYAALFFRIRKRENESALFSQFPWVKTERELKSLKQDEVVKICNLMDLWVRQKLIHIIQNKSIDMHSPQDQLKDSLKEQINSQQYGALNELFSFWGELDLLRFAGKKTKYSDLENSFSKIQKQIDKFS